MKKNIFKYILIVLTLYVIYSSGTQNEDSPSLHSARYLSILVPLWAIYYFKKIPIKDMDNVLIFFLPLIVISFIGFRTISDYNEGVKSAIEYCKSKKQTLISCDYMERIINDKNVRDQRLYKDRPNILYKGWMDR